MARKAKKSKAKNLDELADELNEPQKLFCDLYITDRECFGNAAKSYRTAYNMTPKQYKTTKANAHRLLRKPHVIAYIDKLRDDVFNEKFADRELTTLMKQNRDLPSKAAAIKEFNKLKQRITEKTDITSAGEPIKAINYIVPKK